MKTIEAQYAHTAELKAIDAKYRKLQSELVEGDDADAYDAECEQLYEAEEKEIAACHARHVA